MAPSDAWQSWLSNIPSAQVYIDWAWYVTVTSALERRVWMTGLGPECEYAIWPNQFIMFVGSPGAGKGRAMGFTSSALSSVTDNGEPIFFSGAASGSMQGIVLGLQDCAKSLGDYHYHAQFIESPEMGITFKRGDTDMTAAWQALYDSKDFRKKLVEAKESFNIKNICLNFIAGTQPDWIKKNLGDAHFGEGFMSRFVIVFADRPRFERDVTEPAPHHGAAKKIVVEHLRKLSKLYGRVEFTKAALEYRKEIIEPADISKSIRNLRLNPSKYLSGYYDRKMLHWFKLILGMHFSESTEMLIDQPVCEAAYRFLSSTERDAHKAFDGMAKNPLFEFYEMVEKFISLKGGCDRRVLLREMTGRDLGRKELEDIIETLLASGRIRRENDRFFGTKGA